MFFFYFSKCIKIIYDAHELRELSLRNNEFIKNQQLKILEEAPAFEEIIRYSSDQEDEGNINEIILECDSSCYCDKCDFTGSDKKEVLEHLLESHVTYQKKSTSKSRNRRNQISNSLCCQYCGASSFKSKQIFHQHIKRHVDGERFKCDKCPMKFRSWSEIYYHKAVHTTERNFICDFEGCGKAFKGKRDLRGHKSRHETKNVKNFGCINCGLKLKSKYSLNRHLLIHDGIKQHACTFCSKSFAQKTELNKHMRCHVGENTYECSFPACNDSFRLLSELRIHEEIHFIK